MRAFSVLWVFVITVNWDCSPMLLYGAGLAGAALLGGLWLADGRRRGAALALAVDLLHVGALLLGGRWGLDLFLNAALGAAVVWVWPQLQAERDAVSRAARQAADAAEVDR